MSVPDIAGSDFEADCERAEVDFMARRMSPEGALSDSVGWKHEIQGSVTVFSPEVAINGERVRFVVDAMARWRLFAGMELHSKVLPRYSVAWVDTTSTRGGGILRASAVEVPRQD